MVMMVISIHPSIYIVSGWSAWQQDDLPGSPASLSCTYDCHTTQVCLCKHLGDKCSEFVIFSFFGFINCTNHLSIKVFRHCSKIVCHPQRHLRLPLDSHGHEQGREDDLDGVAQLDWLPLGHNHLGRLAGGVEGGPVVCACHGEYVGRAPQTWRNLQVNSNVPTPRKRSILTFHISGRWRLQATSSACSLL